MMKRFRSERGQSLLEFALILMVMFFIGVAALDLGRVFFSMIVITNASREAARVLTVTESYEATKNAAIRESDGTLVSLSPVDVLPSCIGGDGACVSGNPATVTVNYEFALTTNLFFPSTIPFSRTTRMIVP